MGDGGPGTQAGLRDPTGVVVDVRGNLYIVDAGDHRIRRVEALGGGAVMTPSKSPDFDENGRVDFDDFFLFAGAFGQKATGDTVKYDLDGSGQVDFNDFFIFAEKFGK